MNTWHIGAAVQTTMADQDGYAATAIRPVSNGDAHAYLIERKLDGARMWDTWLADTPDGPRRYIGSIRSDGTYYFAIDASDTRVTGFDLTRADDARVALIDAALRKGLVLGQITPTTS